MTFIIIIMKTKLLRGEVEWLSDALGTGIPNITLWISLLLKTKREINRINEQIFVIPKSLNVCCEEYRYGAQVRAIQSEKSNKILLVAGKVWSK